MNYYVLVVGSERVSALVEEVSGAIGEKITLLTEKLATFDIRGVTQYPVDIVILETKSYSEAVGAIINIREQVAFRLIPILLVSTRDVYQDIQKVASFGAVDFIHDDIDVEDLTCHLRFNVNLSMSMKRVLGENKIFKNKLVELEKLRVKNQSLFDSAQTLGDINSELKRQSEEIKKQKHELEIEKRRSEELLLNILPEETSRELLIHGVTKTQMYRRVTVLFSDFQGFTRTCENMPPQDIVNELDRYFSKFDEICEQHFVEKIKTIGDAYMCAGGIPMRNNSNPVDVILVGLRIVRYMDEVNREKLARGLQPWNVRVGVNTGSIIAGVIGKKKFAYDIWGDTVNTASRMETSGEVGRVNISGQTYEHVKKFFDCLYRGKVEAKNKGEVDMYFVLGIKPELSVDGEGVVPNKEFIVKLAKL